jgi:membrane protease YdiL (CAAX protease family)
MRPLLPGVSALVEVSILFLPAIPAYIWLWPAVEGTRLFYPVQSLVYIYVLAGTLYIGLRRWDWGQLGLNRQGFFLGLICGAVLIVERLLAHLALGFPLELRQFSFARVIGEVFFYFALVGFIEELLFRGLVYRALYDWHGAILAILGSSIGFALWHVGWAGPLAMAHFILGLIFALVRWRGGGILGLIIAHGLFDLVAVEFPLPVSMETVDHLLQLTIANSVPLIVGDILLLAWVVYLLRIRNNAKMHVSKGGFK